MSSIKLKHSGGNSVSLNPPTSAPTSSEVAFKLPTSDGSAGQVLQTDGSGNLSWVTLPSSGLSVAQQFRQTGNTATNASRTYFTSNWAKVDSTGQGGYGSFADPSSGIFTFPSTGFYHVTFHSYFEDAGLSSNCQIVIHATTDNSSYNSVAETSFGTQYDNTGYNYQSGVVTTIIDVTDVTQVKVKFSAYSNSSVSWDGSTDSNRTYATFLRLGDT